MVCISENFASTSKRLYAADSRIASIDYNPFGRVSSKAGTKADDMPFQFSTKYLDNETELSYYGYRYYSPDLGRWINRDPIGEDGGVNLYGMVGNNVVDRWDLFGNECCAGQPLLDGQKCCKIGKTETPYGAGECCCKTYKKTVRVSDIFDEYRNIIQKVRDWDDTSSGWRPWNQCNEQANGLINKLSRSKYTYWNFAVTGGRKPEARSLIGKLLPNQHYVVKVVAVCGGDCPSSFIIDPFKGVPNMPGNDPSWENNSSEIDTVEHFDEMYPRATDDLTRVEKLTGIRF